MDQSIFSGCTPASPLHEAGTSVGKTLERVQVGGSLSFIAKGRSSDFSLFVSLSLFNAVSATAFLTSFFLFQECWLITERAHAMLLS